MPFSYYVDSAPGLLLASNIVMITILKFNDGETILEAEKVNTNDELDIVMGKEDDPMSWLRISLKKQESQELLNWLKSEIKQFD